MGVISDLAEGGAAQKADTDAGTPLCPTCGGTMKSVGADTIAKSAGFPMAGSAGSAAPTQPVPAARATPTLNTGVGTTEIIPGGMDMVRSLFSDLIPNAGASGTAAPPPAGSKSIINATKVPVPVPSIANPTSRIAAQGGVRG